MKESMKRKRKRVHKKNKKTKNERFRKREPIKADELVYEKKNDRNLRTCIVDMLVF